jgi:hypothetical protein
MCKRSGMGRLLLLLTRPFLSVNELFTNLAKCGKMKGITSEIGVVLQLAWIIRATLLH